MTGNFRIHPSQHSLPRRLRRLHRVWPDRNGIISYYLTVCVEGRACVLANTPVFDRFTSFLLDSPSRYRWFGRRFVIMPDHIHLIARMGSEAVKLGEWIKALKSIVGGSSDRSWKWQKGYHDHVFRNVESEARKWIYTCLNPVRERLTATPEEWPFGGEIFYEGEQAPVLIKGTPPLLQTGILIEEDSKGRSVNSADD